METPLIETYFREFGAQVRAYARLTVGEAGADDVTSETFAIALRRLREPPYDPLPWLLGVARNVARNHLRSERRNYARSAELAWNYNASASDASDVVVTRLHSEEIFSSLTESSREVLLVWALSDSDSAAVARGMGLRPGAFRTRLHRARHELSVIARNLDLKGD